MHAPVQAQHTPHGPARHVHGVAQDGRDVLLVQLFAGARYRRTAPVRLDVVDAPRRQRQRVSSVAVERARDRLRLQQRQRQQQQQ